MTRARLPQHHPTIPKDEELQQDLTELRREFDCRQARIVPLWTSYFRGTIRQIGWEVNCAHSTMADRFDGTEEFCLNCRFFDPRRVCTPDEAGVDG
jgi:hypothetical protein